MSKWKAELVSDPSQAKAPGAIRLMCFSDSHGAHLQIPQNSIKPADILLFAGDLSLVGNPANVISFKEWILHLPVQHRVVIAGNLDLTFESSRLDHFETRIRHYCKTQMPLDSIKSLFMGPDIIYLEHGSTEVCGLKIFGSPYTPEFQDWGFQYRLGEGKNKWCDIPNGTDICMTHGPPKDILDQTSSGFHAGCPDLLEAINRVKPALSIFGHIHEAHGQTVCNNILFCNVALMNFHNEIAHEPTYVDMSLI